MNMSTMIERLAALIVDEGKWPAAAMGLALLAAALLLFRHRNSSLPTRRRVLAALNLIPGVMIAIMALGHLSAVTIKLAVGTLQASPLVLYPIGLVLIVPSVLLILHTRTLIASNEDRGQTTIALNTWLAITLVILGLPNLPLAVPAVLNIAYHLHSRRIVGWAIVSVAMLINVGLFVGSLVFLMSGQSFEQFSGVR